MRNALIKYETAESLQILQFLEIQVIHKSVFFSMVDDLRSILHD